jgi:hypothetical protein
MDFKVVARWATHAGLSSMHDSPALSSRLMRRRARLSHLVSALHRTWFPS